jgi:hypothetical protein
VRGRPEIGENWFCCDSVKESNERRERREMEKKKKDKMILKNNI